MSRRTKNVDPLLSARGRVAYETRLGSDPRKLTAARQDLKAEQVRRAIRQALDEVPPLRDEQRHELAALLLPVVTR